MFLGKSTIELRGTASVCVGVAEIEADVNVAWAEKIKPERNGVSTFTFYVRSNNILFRSFAGAGNVRRFVSIKITYFLTFACFVPSAANACDARKYDTGNSRRSRIYFVLLTWLRLPRGSAVPQLNELMIVIMIWRKTNSGAVFAALK